MFFQALRLSCIAVLLTGCGSVKEFSRTGDKSYCLINYSARTADCSYANMRDCSQEYNKHEHELVHCFRKRDLAKNAINTIGEEDDDGND